MKSIRIFITQLSYTLIANFSKLITVGFLTLIIPKFISQSDYGYWQLYVFYSGYVGFLHFGWCDGIYLREGGKSFKELNKAVYKTQFLYLLFFEILLSLFLMLFIFSIKLNINKTIIFIFICFNTIISTPTTFLSYLLQATGEIKTFALSNIYGRCIYFVITISFLLFGYNNYIMLLVSDLIGLSVSLFYLIYKFLDIFSERINNISLSIKEILINIRIGSKLLLANIASNLIIGVTRIMIENRWTIVEYAKISLSLNFCNLILTFINAISIIAYPLLKRVNQENLKNIFEMMNLILSIFLYGLLLLYLPIKLFISLWIPQYLDSIKYMAILFPICLFEAKVSLITNTYLKVLRKEKVMFLINSFILIISSIISFFSIYVLSNLTLAIFTIVIVIALRSIISELYIAKKLNCNDSLVFELFICSLFIFLNFFLQNDFFSFFVYMLIYILFIFKKRSKIISLLKVVNIKFLK